jgi:hypothetical protein
MLGSEDEGVKREEGRRPPKKNAERRTARQVVLLIFGARVRATSYSPSDFSGAGAPRSCEFTYLQTSFTAFESHWVCVA